MNILITSVGRRGYMIEYFKKVVGATGKIFVSNSVETSAMSKADEFVISPNIYESSYVDFVLKYCKSKDISFVISLFDIDLPVLSKNKKFFADNGITILLSDYDFVSVCNDKWATYNFLKANEIKTAKTYLSIETCVSAIEREEIMFPIILKPRWGMGSIGVFEAENEEELRVFYNKVSKAISSSYLMYESSIDIDNAIVLQEKLKGKEYGIDIFNDLNGNFLCSVPKKKVAMRAGETDIAETFHSIKFENFAKLLSAKTLHVFNLDVDCFVNEEGEIFVLEMNARFGGQYPFSHISGVNFPKVIYDLLLRNNYCQQDLIFIPTIAYKELSIVK